MKLFSMDNDQRSCSSTSYCMVRKVLLVFMAFCILSVVYYGLFSPGSCGPNSPPEDAIASPVQTQRHFVAFDSHQKERTNKHQPVYNISQHKTLHYHQGLELYIHTAFLDDRFPETIIRIIGLQKKDEIKQEFVCKWKTRQYGIQTSIEVKANRVLIDPTWPHWSLYLAVTFDCHFPPKSNLSHIELVSKDGIHSYSLQVEQTMRPSGRERGTLAVCVKPITGQFKVARIVEWFEIMRMVGITDFLLYTTDIIGSARFVVEYYKSLGVAKTITFPYLMSILQHIDDPPMKSGEERYAAYQQTYLVAMNDCLYRFRGQYENLLFIDIDEVLLPTQEDRTLIDVIKNIRKSYIYGAGYLFKTAWHFEEHQDKDDTIPPYMYMHRHSKGSAPADNQPKSIIVTDRAISLNFHSILDVPSSEYSNEELPWQNTAYIHHFRGKCDDKFEDWRCKELFKKYQQDPVLPRYKEGLNKRIGQIIERLDLH